MLFYHQCDQNDQMRNNAFCILEGLSVETEVINFMSWMLLKMLYEANSIGKMQCHGSRDMI